MPGRRRGPGPSPGPKAGPGPRRGPGPKPRRRNKRQGRRRRRRRVVLVGGLVAFGSYKLGKSQVQQVEQYSGRSVEEMSDQEVDQAVKELNIEAEEMSDEELGYIDELECLGELHDQGQITDEEFETKKKQLLGL